MKEPTLMKVAPIPIEDITTGSRLRPASEAGIASILASVGELGVIKDPIHVRATKRGLVLIAGLHRLEAAKRLGWSMIEAKVWSEVSDDWARLMEIDDNLAGAELNALDTAVFLATRKAVYERLHPETKRGVAGARGRWDATEPGSVAFVQATAGKFGLTERQVYKIVAAGHALTPQDTQLLRAAARPVTLKDLGVIAKVTNAAERYSLVEALARGEARSAAEARRKLAGERPLETPLKTDADEGFRALAAAWSRASPAARKRFCLEHRAELWETANKGAPLHKWAEAGE